MARAGYCGKHGVQYPCRYCEDERARQEAERERVNALWDRLHDAGESVAMAYFADPTPWNNFMEALFAALSTKEDADRVAKIFRLPPDTPIR